jgi:ABC-type uncharacterized transport system involved in gliding motility auxiliary subunit
MKKSPSNRLFSMIAGIFLLFAIAVAVNVASSAFHFRKDLTEDQLYTLSPQTKTVLTRLDTPVTIKFYFSRSSNRMPVFLKNYAKQVLNLLNEYRLSGRGNVVVEKFDPEPDSDAEDAANLDGIKGQTLNTGDTIYMGIAISCLDQTVSIPFLNPEQDNTLEYEITRAITQVVRVEKPLIGLMSALPVLGEKFNPRMLQMGGMAGMEPWIFADQLKRDFDIVEIPLDASDIDPKIDTLLVVHPSGISPKTEFAIDQFVLRGGKLIAFVDPSSYYAIVRAREKPEYGAKSSSNLNTLFNAWGVRYDDSKVVADMTLGKRVGDVQRRLTFTTVLDVTAKGIDQKEIVTANLNTLTMIFSGGFVVEPKEHLAAATLVRTTPDSCLLPASIANDPEQSFKNFNQDEETYSLAVLLSGTFKTAFPEGKPGDEADKPEGLNDAPKGNFLKEGLKETIVLLVADSDILVDDVCVRVQNFLGQKLMTPLNQNLVFGQNAVDYASGDQALIGIRCRSKVGRPFEVVKELQSEAEKRYKSRVERIEQELKETERRINELQRQKSKEEMLVLSPEQKAEIKKFQEKQVEIRRDLKTVTKELRRDIDALQNRLKLINIAMMPAVVILFGIGVAVIRKRRSAAK